MAFARCTHESFGGADCLRMVDDELFALRARMLGPELVLQDRLVLYRLGTGISNSLWGMREPMVRGRRDLLAALRQARRDLGKVAGRMSAPERDEWDARLDGAERRTEAELALFAGETFAARLDGFRKTGPARLLSVWQFLRLAFLLPRPVGSCLLHAYAAVRYAARRAVGIML